jgi:hypothetical protein
MNTLTCECGSDTGRVTAGIQLYFTLLLPSERRRGMDGSNRMGIAWTGVRPSVHDYC